MARWAVSKSVDYGPERVEIRDFESTPKGRVLCVIERDDLRMAEWIAQHICDLLNKEENNGILQESI